MKIIFNILLLWLTYLLWSVEGNMEILSYPAKIGTTHGLDILDMYDIHGFGHPGYYKGPNWFHGNWAYNPQFGWMPWFDAVHEPLKLTTPFPRFIDGNKVPHGSLNSPDFRIPEPPFLAFKWNFYKEANRPYRISPVNVYLAKWQEARPRERPWNLNCACVIAYKFNHPLAGGAILTPRHVLTTATPIETVLERVRNYASLKNLINIIYEMKVHQPHFNTTTIAFPARIHYHPDYLRPNMLNRSHPLPLHDLAVLTTTANMVAVWNKIGTEDRFIQVICCKRAPSGQTSLVPESYLMDKQLYVVGSLFIFTIHRNPMVYFKYSVRLAEPNPSTCDKKDWGWFYCISTEWFARYGLDSGATLFMDTMDAGGQRSMGLLGMSAFNMRLRGPVMKSYFQPLDTHSNLEFLYNAYNGRLPYEFLDYRYDDTQFRTPKMRAGFVRQNTPHQMYNSVVQNATSPWQ